MDYEMREGQGSLFVNDRKETENQPDYKGSCLIQGQECWIAGWKKQSAGGKNWMSLSIQPKEKAQAETQAETQATPQAEAQF